MRLAELVIDAQYGSLAAGVNGQTLQFRLSSPEEPELCSALLRRPQLEKVFGFKYTGTSSRSGRSTWAATPPLSEAEREYLGATLAQRRRVLEGRAEHDFVHLPPGERAVRCFPLPIGRQRTRRRYTQMHMKLQFAAGVTRDHWIHQGRLPALYRLPPLLPPPPRRPAGADAIPAARLGWAADAAVHGTGRQAL